MTVTDARLRQAGDETSWPAAADELRQLVSDARQVLRDKTLDLPKSALQQLNAATGQLAGALSKREQQRKLQADITAGAIVPWPKPGQESA